MDLTEAADQAGSQVVAVVALLQQWRAGIGQVNEELFGGQAQNLRRDAVADLAEAFGSIAGDIAGLMENMSDSIDDFGGDTNGWDEAVAALRAANSNLDDNGVRRTPAPYRSNA